MSTYFDLGIILQAAKLGALSLRPSVEVRPNLEVTGNVTGPTMTNSRSRALASGVKDALSLERCKKWKSCLFPMENVT